MIVFSISILSYDTKLIKNNYKSVIKYIKYLLYQI